jgi:hypothetical protein
MRMNGHTPTDASWRGMVDAYRTQVEEEMAFHSATLAREEAEFLTGVTIPLPYRVVLTCSCVPEQWDIYIGDTMTGYLRCRYSRWSLEYPDCGGEVLISEPWHPEVSEYESNFDDERPSVFERVFRTLDERRSVGA